MSISGILSSIILPFTFVMNFLKLKSNAFTFSFSIFNVTVLSVISKVIPDILACSILSLSRNFISSSTYLVPSALFLVVILILKVPFIPIYPLGTTISCISYMNSCPSSVISILSVLNVPSPLFVNVITCLSSVIIVNSAPGISFPSLSTLFIFNLKFPSNISSLSILTTGCSSASANHKVAIVLYILPYSHLASIFTSSKLNSVSNSFDIFM